MIARFQFPLIFLSVGNKLPPDNASPSPQPAKGIPVLWELCSQKRDFAIRLGFPLFAVFQFAKPAQFWESQRRAPLHRRRSPAHLHPPGCRNYRRIPHPRDRRGAGGGHVHRAAAQQGDAELQGSGPAAPGATPSKPLLQEGKGSFLPSRRLTLPAGARDKAAPFPVPGEVFKAGGAFPGPSAKSLWCRLQESPGFEGMLEALAEAE